MCNGIYTRCLDEHSGNTYSSYDVDDWSLVFVIFVVFPGFLRHQGPQFFHIDRWTEKLVKSFVEVPHTNFTKVTWMAEKQSVLYSAKGITCISQSSNKDIEKNSSKNQRYMQRKGLTNFYSKPNFVYNNYIWLEHHIYTQELHVKIFFTYFNI